MPREDPADLVAVSWVECTCGRGREDRGEEGVRRGEFCGKACISSFLFSSDSEGLTSLTESGSEGLTSLTELISLALCMMIAIMPVAAVGVGWGEG